MKYCSNPDVLNTNEPASGMYRKKPSRKRQHKKRSRKNGDQLSILAREFFFNSEWSKGMMARLANMTGLNEAQVYKWGWDQRRKQQYKVSSGTVGLCKLFSPLSKMSFLKKSDFEYSNENVGIFASKEVLVPGELDNKLYCIQAEYKMCMRGII